MIFINKSADYSAVSIGHIDLPRPADEATTAILAKYTKTLTDTQKRAFDNLVVGLKDASLFTHVKDWFIPCLANSTSEALIDASVGTNPLSDLSIYGMSDYGLIQNGNHTNDHKITLTGYNNNVTLFAVVNILSGSGTQICDVSKKTIDTGAANTLDFKSGTKCFTGANPALGFNIMVNSYDGTNADCISIKNGTQYSVTTVGTGTQDVPTYLQLGQYVATKGNTENVISVFGIIDKYMNATEAKALCTLLTQFKNAFFA